MKEQKSFFEKSVFSQIGVASCTNFVPATIQTSPDVIFLSQIYSIIANIAMTFTSLSWWTEIEQRMSTFTQQILFIDCMIFLPWVSSQFLALNKISKFFDFISFHLVLLKKFLNLIVSFQNLIVFLGLLKNVMKRVESFENFFVFLGL